MKQEKVYIYGKHAVLEAIKSMPEALDKVFLRDNNDHDLQEALKKAGISASPLGGNKGVKEIKNSEPHQGVIASVSLEKLMRPYKEYISNLKIEPRTSLVLLGEIQDPHNVGAIIRSAAAFGVSGVLIPEHNQAPITGTVIKVSAGMAFNIPLISIGNVNTTIRDLKDRGFWVYGLDGEAKQSINNENYEKPSVFVLGNESKGIRQKTNELCDTLISIPTDERCESLNVAASAAVVLYSWSLQHPVKK